MRVVRNDVVVIGAGPAGLAAAISAKKAGAKRITIVERDFYLGGILQQCIHQGFGLKYFNKEFTGPEYAQEFIEQVKKHDISIMSETMALELRTGSLLCVNSNGLIKLEAGAFVLAMGCRERTRGNLSVPGSRPAGIYTAGTAQRIININGHMVGKQVVIVGSGDIGMIMARRLTLEGAHVKAVVELLPYLTGLIRNKVQCLDDFSIPLYLSQKIIDIKGVDRVERVTIVSVDKLGNSIKDSERHIECDTVLFSVGLIPENELTRNAGIHINNATRGPEVNQFMQTELPSVFACGNVVHVNDLVDNVSCEGEIAGHYAALYAESGFSTDEEISVIAGNNVGYICPQRLSKAFKEDAKLYFRVEKPGKNLELLVSSANKTLFSKRFDTVNPGSIEVIPIHAETIRSLEGSLFVGFE